MLADSQVLINAILVRLVAYDAVQVANINVLDPFYLESSCQLPPKTHDRLNDGCCTTFVSQNSEPFAMSKGERNPTDGPDSKIVPCRLEQQTIRLAGFCTLFISFTLVMDPEALKLVDMQKYWLIIDVSS